MIYVDFDGTIVDVWKRYYQIFVTLTNSACLGFHEYVRAKRKMKNDGQIEKHFSLQLQEN